LNLDSSLMSRPVSNDRINKVVRLAIAPSRSVELQRMGGLSFISLGLQCLRFVVRTADCPLRESNRRYDIDISRRIS
jgi:hypothetical protein